MSLKNKIVEYLKQEYPRTIHKGEIGRKAVLEWGYENENAGRRCRELENEKLIEKIPHAKGEAQYRYVVKDLTPKVMPQKEESISEWAARRHQQKVEEAKVGALF